MRRLRSKPFILALALAVTGTLMAASSPVESVGMSEIVSCGHVNTKAEPHSEPVSARIPYSCDKAKPVARRFLRSGDLPSGWKKGNFAGCEWVLGPASSKSKLRDVWKVRTVKLHGCND